MFYMEDHLRSNSADACIVHRDIRERTPVRRDAAVSSSRGGVLLDVFERPDSPQALDRHRARRRRLERRLERRLRLVRLLEVLEREPPPHCLLYTSPSPRDATLSRMPSSA